MNLHDTAKTYLAAGLSVLPAFRVQKRPASGGWKTYAGRLPTAAELDAWFDNAPDAVCLIGGSVSGNLECIDFDCAGAAYDAWSKLVPPGTIPRLLVEKTPSGGYHAVYRCEAPVEGNQKLAQKLVDDKIATLIETRGEGGLFLCAPTEGYTLLWGDYAALPVLTEAERASLLDAARALNEVVEAPQAMHTPTGPASGFADRPGDDYNARGDLRETLVKHGWEHVGGPADNEHWRRPGKTSGTNSATFDGSVFYVFSPNAAPFEANKGYSKFQAYALLEHGGDFTAAAKALLDAGFGRAADPEQGVDLSGILDDDGPDEPDAPDVPDPGPLPPDLLSVPGFVDGLAAYTLRTAPYPNRVLAFAGAMTMLAMLTGRKFEDELGNQTNLYLVSLADSGTGKDRPRKVNFELAQELGVLDSVGDAFASGEGLEDAVFLSPSMLFMCDEMDSLLNTLKTKDARAETMNAALLKFFTSSGSVYPMRRKAIGRSREGDVLAQAPGFIVKPNLSVLGTAVPQYFYESLSRRALENGLVARCLILEAEPRGFMHRPVRERIPDGIRDIAKRFRDMGPGVGNLAGLTPEPVVVGETASAAIAFDESARRCDEEYARAHANGDVTAQTLWSRAYEKIRKLALLRALSANAVGTVIHAKDVEWATRFVEHSTRRMLFMASRYVHENVFDEMVQKVVRIIEKRGGSIAHSDLLKRSHLDCETFRKIMETLEQSRTVRVTKRLAGQRPRTVYEMA